jgi:GWxTD domain-containing protein
VNRTSWRDTAFASNYDITQQKEQTLVGYTRSTVAPGRYYYLFQLERPDSNTPATPLRKPLTVRPFDQAGNATFYLMKPNSSMSNGAPLMLMGHNVNYGQDFDLLVQIPDYTADSQYELTIKQLNVQDRDTTAQGTEYTQSIQSNDILPNSLLDIRKVSGELHLTTQSNADGYRYAHVTIPNSEFSNSHYRITLTEKGDNQPLGQFTYQSKWVDIPISLLNVDVAIDMLRYITSESKIKDLYRGNKQQKVDNFNEFWRQRDPTPDTPFNELMAEYYRRIDYAFQEYSTPNKPGFDTDQGKVYISYGPPENIERSFPTDSRAVEVWEYPNKTFRFQATSGFGDFKLIDRSSK